MAKYKSADIRNIVLCGHSGSGKTMLAEAMLKQAGVIGRLGSIVDGSTVADYEDEEQERQHSLTSSVMHCSFDGKEFRITDTPGGMDFIGGAIGGIAGADLAVICINASKGIELMARKAWDYAGSAGLGRMIAVCRMDSENVNFQELMAGIKNTFGASAVSFTIPHGEGESFESVTRVMADDAHGDEVDARKIEITESAVECDDKLVERYLEGGEVTHDEVLNVMHKAIAQGHIVPVFAVSAEKDIGVVDLMHGLADWGTSPLDNPRHAIKGEEKVEFHASEDGPFMAQVVKVVSDPHVGKLCFCRVQSGSIASKSSAYVSSSGKAEKLAQLQLPQGGKRTDVEDAIAGDIVVVSKIDNLHIGDTLYAKGVEERFKPIPFPQPMAGLAVSAKSRGDEQKMGQNIGRLCEEDPTFIFERNELTNEQVIRGIGQIHLDVMLHKLKRRYGTEVSTKPPRVPYLETISKAGDGRYRHKKQSGGSGQFGEVWMRIKPNERGGGFQFVNQIVGGAISGPFIPSVEKGVRSAMEEGPVAGFPMVDVVVELYDGKEHPVDSKDIAFQLAGRHGFHEIVQQCKAVLLEPYVTLDIVTPGEYMGDITGDISTRRGRPTGMEQMGEMQVLKVLVPLSEVSDYGSILSGITQGAGFYSMELAHYEPVPSNIAQQVAAKLKAEAEEEK